MVHWESETFADSPKDEARLFLRDMFPPTHRDYQHLYYGMHMGTFLAPPPGQEVLLEMMAAISRYDPSMGGYGKSIEGMLVLTDLRLLFLPDMSCGSATASFVEFHTVQVFLAAIRSFSHRGLEGGSRLLSVATRDGRSVHFRMAAAASSARCGAWYDAERSGRRSVPGSNLGEEELWKKGLWGATTSEEWMERVVDEIRWRKAQGNFMALWCKLIKTSASGHSGDSRAHGSSATGDGKGNGSKGSRGGAGSANSVPSSDQASTGVTAATNASVPGESKSHTTKSGQSRGDVSDGWAALERDLERVGVQGIMASSYIAFGRQNWEVKTVNKDYALVPTYPQTLAFPSTITPAQLASAAPQRSRNRLPALVWLHPTSRAPLVRSSQPMAGMTTKVLNEDIFLLKQIRVTLDATKISIVDARSLLNAKANQVTGKGFEDVADIGRDVATLEFMGIDNIHVVRDSLGAFSTACHSPGQDYLQAIGASGWLKHLAQIMKGAAFVVDEIQRGVAVLVHCSDGWDRTSQLTALAQLYLDPYYRTLEGFEILVEKEWCSFGHMFGLRAHSDSPTESSPIFLQWLDAVWQLVRQYPAAFEFTGHYLERLVEGLYSAGFMTFAGNCEKERREKLKELQEAGSEGISIFAYLREHAMEGHITAPLVNPLYHPRVKESATVGSGVISPLQDTDILRPCCEAQGLEIWQAVYMRDSLLLHHREHQLSVEKGLRLQIYDISRRMDFLEAYIHRLPKGLVKQLVSSAAEMAGDGWHRQQRLVDLASSERDTRRVGLGPGGSASGGGSSALAGSGAPSSRGRSLQRGSQGNKSSDDGSRSRSRSFNLPMRSWAAGAGRSGGERRQRWGSQDSARETDLDEDPDTANARADGSGSVHSAASGSNDGRLGVEGRGSSGPGEEELERTSRSRSFFSFARRGRPKMLGTPAVDGSDDGERDTNRPAVEDKHGDQGASRKGRGERRRSASTAGVERGGDATGGYDSGRGGRARGLTDASDLREKESHLPNSGRVAESGNVSSTTGSHAVSHRNSARERLVHSKSLRAFDGGSEMSRGQLQSRHARQGTSVEAVRFDDATLSLRQRAMSIAAALERKDGSEVDDGYRGGVDGSSKGTNRWTFSRRSRLSKNSALKESEDESGTGTDKKGSAAEKDKKGIFRTQRRIGDRSTSSSSITFGKSASAAKNSEGHGVERSASRFGVGSSKEYARTTGGRGPGFRTNKSSPAESVTHGGEYTKAEEEAEARREMLHTIATLEVQLLIKEVVDEACFLASKRRVDDPGMTFKMVPQSSSRPASTASERPMLFNDAWTAGGVQRRYPRIGMGEEKRGLGSRTASAPETVSTEDSRVVDTSSGTGYSAESASAPARRGSDAFGGRDVDKVNGNEKDTKDKDSKNRLEDVGFFEVLRRKLFEGQDTPTPTTTTTTKVEGGEKKGMEPTKRASAMGAQPSASSAVATAAPVTAPRAASFASQVPDHPGAPEKDQDFFGTRSMSTTGGSRVYNGRQTKASWRIPEAKATDADPESLAKGVDRGTRLDTSTSNPDAGAGGKRSTDAGEMISGSEKIAEAAEVAAKFGLVRMVFGDS